LGVLLSRRPSLLAGVLCALAMLQGLMLYLFVHLYPILWEHLRHNFSQLAALLGYAGWGCAAAARVFGVRMGRASRFIPRLAATCCGVADALKG
jgi:hypothetical protein